MGVKELPLVTKFVNPASEYHLTVAPVTVKAGIVDPTHIFLDSTSVGLLGANNLKVTK